MAVQTLPGASVPWTHPALIAPGTSIAPALGNTATIDATGEKASFVGRVFFSSRTGTKDIRTIGFRFGSVTKAGGSALTASLQDVSTAAGPPMQPDETQDQTVAIANADAGFTSNVWYQTGNLSADRTVAFGELLAVVVEYDGGGRLGADTVSLSCLGTPGNAVHDAMVVLKTASWAALNAIPNVIFGFSDGTFGTLNGALPMSATGTLTYNSGTAGSDEYALEMTWPGPLTIDGGGGAWNQAANADAELILYTGTTATKTVALSHRHVVSAGGARYANNQFDAMVALAATTTYRLALKPTTANNIGLYYFDVANAAHLQAHIGGEAWALTARLNSGAWDAPTTTRRPFLWPYVSGIGDDVSGGGAAGWGSLTTMIYCPAGVVGYR